MTSKRFRNPLLYPLSYGRRSKTTGSGGLKRKGNRRRSPALPARIVTVLVGEGIAGKLNPSNRALYHPCRDFPFPESSELQLPSLQIPGGGRRAPERRAAGTSACRKTRCSEGRGHSAFPDFTVTPLKSPFTCRASCLSPSGLYLGTCASPPRLRRQRSNSFSIASRNGPSMLPL